MRSLMWKVASVGVLVVGMCASSAGAADSQGLDAQKHLTQVIGRADHTHVVVYGDVRFTDPSEHDATNVAARQALITAIADEAPQAVFITGDVPWHGGDVQDYAVFQQETKRWSESGIGVWPILGNHEFQKCAEATCLEHWWQTFPVLKGTRWYSASLGSSALAVALDSNDSLLEGSPQLLWLDDTLRHARSSDRFVLILLHHPPVADLADGAMASHNPRPNELALKQFLAQASLRYPKLRFVVVAGHVHNYEHFERDGIVYLVSGGGGAKPYPVERTADDLYLSNANPINFHYLRFTILSARLSIEMLRLTDPMDPHPHRFKVADRIELTAASQNP